MRAAQRLMQFLLILRGLGHGMLNSPRFELQMSQLYRVSISLPSPSARDSILSMSSSVELHVPLIVSIFAVVAHRTSSQGEPARNGEIVPSYALADSFRALVCVCVVYRVFDLCRRRRFRSSCGVFRMDDAALNFVIQGYLSSPAPAFQLPVVSEYASVSVKAWMIIEKMRFGFGNS